MPSPVAVTHERDDKRIADSSVRPLLEERVDGAHVAVPRDAGNYCLVSTVPSPKVMVLPDIEKLTS